MAQKPSLGERPGPSCPEDACRDEEQESECAEDGMCDDHLFAPWTVVLVVILLLIFVFVVSKDNLFNVNTNVEWLSCPAS